MGIAAVTLPSLRQVAAKAFSIETTLDTAGQIAALILLFYAGLRAPKRGDQKLGRAGLWVGLATAGLTLVLGLVIGVHLGYGRQHSGLLAAIAMTPSLAFTGVIDISSRQHSTVISAAKRFNQILVGFIFGFLLLLTNFGAKSSPLGEARTGVIPAILLVKTALFFAFAWFLGSRYAQRFAQNPKKGLTIRLLVGFVLLLILLYVYASQFLGQLVALTWAYLAGVLFAKTAFGEPLVPGLQRLTHLICLPLLFFSAGLKVQFGIWSAGLVLIVGIATVGRVGGASLGAKGGSQTWREPLAAGLMTIPQAEVGVILASHALDRGFVGGGEFSVLILAAIGTTLLGSMLAGRLKSPLAVAVDRREPSLKETQR
jgi:Kef-type K+ transport system membrane component KefB